MTLFGDTRRSWKVRIGVVMLLFFFKVCIYDILKKNVTVTIEI